MQQQAQRHELVVRWQLQVYSEGGVQLSLCIAHKSMAANSSKNVECDSQGWTRQLIGTLVSIFKSTATQSLR
jgi:hypothetical protein